MKEENATNAVHEDVDMKTQKQERVIASRQKRKITERELWNHCLKDRAYEGSAITRNTAVLSYVKDLEAENLYLKQKCRAYRKKLKVEND